MDESGCLALNNSTKPPLMKAATPPLCLALLWWYPWRVRNKGWQLTTCWRDGAQSAPSPWAAILCSRFSKCQHLEVFIACALQLTCCRRRWHEQSLRLLVRSRCLVWSQCCTSPGSQQTHPSWACQGSRPTRMVHLHHLVDGNSRVRASVKPNKADLDAFRVVPAALPAA